MTIPPLYEVCERALALPCSPVLLPRLAQVLANPDSDVDELAQLVQLDPVLASSTVRLANSSYFAGSDVATVAEAVMRLGARELYRLAALSMAARWMAIKVDGYRWEAGDFCRASLVKAVAAETLADRTGHIDPALAYTAGLVHEIGKLAVAYTCAGHFAAVRKHQLASGGTWMEAERAVLGYRHADVSARLLAEWKFPPLCVAVAQHNPPTADLTREERALAAHLHAAQHLSAAFGAGQGEDAFLFRLDEALLEEWGLGAAVLESELPRILERTAKVLRDRLSVGEIRL